MRPLRHLFEKACRIARHYRSMNRLVCKTFQVWYDLPFNPYYLPRGQVGEVFTSLSQLPFPPAHYYSPLPDIKALKSKLARWYKESCSPGIDWNVKGQIRLAEDIVQYAVELKSLPSFAQVTRSGYGPGYGEVEAHTLYMLLRHLKPSRVVEVGSGVSTFYSLRALKDNSLGQHTAAQMTCIEPHANDTLRKLASDSRVRLLEKEVQDIGFPLFEELSDRDVLFIDSSHVSKKDSDVDFLYLEVLPRLRKGVIVHIHDMPFPMPAIPREHSLFDTYLFWNESALVSAFLRFNNAFRVLMCQSYLHYKEPEVLKRLDAAYNPKQHFPSSLWLEKVL